MIINGKRSSNLMWSTWVESCFLPFLTMQSNIFGCFHVTHVHLIPFMTSSGETIQSFSTPAYSYYALHTYIYIYTHIHVHNTSHILLRLMTMPGVPNTSIAKVLWVDPMALKKN